MDIEEGLRARVRRWFDGCPGDGEKGIPCHLVTRERLISIGLAPSQVASALRFVADPYNHGVDERMTPKDRRGYADSQRFVTPEPQDEPEPPAPPRHWSEAPTDAHHATLRAARANNPLMRP